MARGGHDGAATQLTREACVLESLRDPGVPRVYECGLREGRPWIALELLDGPTLAEAIRDRAMSPAELLVVVRDVAEVLHHGHTRGVVHGHLVPASIVRHQGGLCLAGWGHAPDEADPRDDVAALGKLVALALAPPMTRPIVQLVDRMTAEIAFARPSAAEVRAAVIRLLEDDHVEEVEIELVEDLDEETLDEPMRAATSAS
jgi:serine/threonine protein kinase